VWQRCHPSGYLKTAIGLLIRHITGVRLSQDSAADNSSLSGYCDKKQMPRI
jgi:hypothetical protein